MKRTLKEILATPSKNSTPTEQLTWDAYQLGKAEGKAQGITQMCGVPSQELREEIDGRLNQTYGIPLDLKKLVEDALSLTRQTYIRMEHQKDFETEANQRTIIRLKGEADALNSVLNAIEGNSIHLQEKAGN